MIAIAAAALLLCTVTHAQTSERQRDSLERAERQLDTLRRSSPSLGTNLFYWGSGTPNAHFWLPVGDHITRGVTEDGGETIEDTKDKVYTVYFDDVRQLRAEGNRASSVGLFLKIKYFGPAIAVESQAAP